MPTRRAFLTQSALAAAAAIAPRALIAAPTAIVADPAVARTPLGSLRGELVDHVRIFRGIPFAQPPIGSLRFHPPQKLRPWAGIRDATKFPAAAIQPGASSGYTQSEDCLYLNVWAPQTKGPHPVFVWIHGGGYTSGRSFDPAFNGANFAREGIVFVSVAYRLGVLGFLDLEPILGVEYAASANNALRDLIASLEWVQRNIASFGGDPARVTIGGESAGAKLTDILMGIPSAQLLFHQMISESGGAERIQPRVQAFAASAAFADEWRRISKTDPVTALPAADPRELMVAQVRFIAAYPQHFPLRPELDGVLAPHIPVDAIRDGSTRGKRLLLGTNLDESASFIGPHPSKDAAAADLGNIPLPRFQSVYARYKSIYPSLTDEQRRIRAVTAEEYWLPSTRVIDAHVTGGGSAYMYRLDFAETSGRLKDYAYHSLDIPLVFNDARPQIANAADEATLAKQVHQAWVSFIQGRPPAAPGLPTWTPYNSTQRPTMLLDIHSRMANQPNESELRLWDGVL